MRTRVRRCICCCLSLMSSLARPCPMSHKRSGAQREVAQIDAPSTTPRQRTQLTLNTVHARIFVHVKQPLKSIGGIFRGPHSKGDTASTQQQSFPARVLQDDHPPSIASYARNSSRQGPKKARAATRSTQHLPFLS